MAARPVSVVTAQHKGMKATVLALQKNGTWYYCGTAVSFFCSINTVAFMALWYFLLPQYHKYCGSSARYLSDVDTQ